MMHLFNPACAEHTLTDIGGKGLNLLRLKTICNVPQWFAVPESCFSELLISSGVDQRIVKMLKGINADDIDRRSAEIRGLIVSLSLPEGLISEIEELLQKLAGADGYVAVRSSAGAEDGRRFSFAGVHESFLNVKGREAVCTHIRKVWASGYSAAALRYRRQNKLPLHPVPMAVVVQRMICAKSSGVIFTADPVTESPLKMVISSLYGLGAGLVSAGLEADHCSFDKRSRQMSTIVADKSRQIVLNKAVGYGVYENAVDSQCAVSRPFPLRSSSRWL